MDQLTIPIPDGLDESQKADLTAWLSARVAEIIPERLPCEDDPAWQAQTLARIKRGMADAEAGRVMDARESMRQIAKEFGIKLNR